MQIEPLKRLGVGTLLATLSIAIQPSAQSQTITTFDPPGSIATLPYSINQKGAITGYYIDARYINHGFVRAEDGKITVFDAPGACRCANSGTYPAAINPDGVITGLYEDAKSVTHGFVRAANGAITTFNVPGAGHGLYQGTKPYSMRSGRGDHRILRRREIRESRLRCVLPTARSLLFDVQGASVARRSGHFPICHSDDAGDRTGYATDSNDTTSRLPSHQERRD